MRRSASNFSRRERSAYNALSW